MVEINNQRKVRYAGVVGGTDNGRQKTRNHGYDVIVGGRASISITPDHLVNCHAKPKTQINRRRRYQLFPVGGMPTASSLA